MFEMILRMTMAVITVCLFFFCLDGLPIGQENFGSFAIVRITNQKAMHAWQQTMSHCTMGMARMPYANRRLRHFASVRISWHSGYRRHKPAAQITPRSHMAGADSVACAMAANYCGLVDRMEGVISFGTHPHHQ